MKPLPRAAPGTVVTLDGDLYNCIAENLERLDKWTVKPPLNLHQTPAGNLLSVVPDASEQVLVAILGAETGGGRYKGSILYGNSTGNTTNTFQLQAVGTQTATDGPQWIADIHGAPQNNALVINLLEPYVSGSHLLYLAADPLLYVYGRVMGQTSESTPRTIVYIQSGPMMPVIAKITGSYGSNVFGGAYTGRIVAGQFVNGTNSFQSLFSASANTAAPAADNCWIINAWEQANLPNSNRSILPANTFVPGLLAGYPDGTSTSGVNYWYQVYTWFPPQSATLAHQIQTLATITSAGSTYTANEQTMMNELKTDVTNLRNSLLDLYTNLKAAGYTL